MYNISFILNYAPHYREAVYRLIDKSFDCRFYFGDSVRGNIKKMHYDNFCGRVEELPVRWLFGNWCYYRNALSVLKDNSNIYILTGDMRNLSNWLILIWLRLFCPSKKGMLWTHGWYGKENWLKRAVSKAFYYLADAVCLYGNRAKQLMTNYGLPEQKLYVIHNSLDYDRQLQLRIGKLESNIYRQHFGNNQKVLLFIGRLTAVKQLDMLIRAIYQLPTYNLVIVGDGPMRKQLELLANELEVLDRVWFYGQCYNETENATLIYNADLCVSPGNVGLTAIHSLMFGTPVLTHNNFAYQMPEFESIIEGKTGVFFVQNDLDSMLQYIELWFNREGYDRSYIRQLCYQEIDSSWNPHYQIGILRQMLDNIK